MECSQLDIPHWFYEILNDPEVTDLCLNGGKAIFIDRGQGMEPFHSPDQQNLHESSLRDWVLRELTLAGKTWDAKYPFIDATLSSGHRLHVAFPPLARQGILVSLRRLPSFSFTQVGTQEGAFLIQKKTRWQSPLFDSLVDAVKKGDSILISGSTGSGKTTLANDLLEEVPHSERIVALEDTPELAPHHPHFISLISRPPNADGFGEVALRSLLKQTLRMRPDRIILGECRGTEVLELLQTLNTGHHGSLATLHANSPRDAIRRIELLCLLAAGGSIPISVIRELVVVGVQWVVQVKKKGKERKIDELWKIEGREGDTILMRQVLEFKNHDYPSISIGRKEK
jgi:pilus assembly protein CpaF